MQFKASFFRTCAVASWLAVITTLLLAFLPELDRATSDWDARLTQLSDPALRWSARVHLLHPFVVLAATVAVAVRIRRRNSAAALVSILAFTLWAFTEAALRTLGLFAHDHWYAAQFVETEAVPANVQAAIMYTFDGVRSAFFVLLSIGLIVGSAALGVAMTRSKGMSRTVGYFFVAAGLLALLNVLPAVGMPESPSVLRLWVDASIRAAGYTVIGVWLWRYAMDEG